MTKVIAMIPARLGSQRLKKKNLLEIQGASMLARAVRKASAAEVFSEIWVNSEAPEIRDIAAAEGVPFHQRPEELAGHNATSEEFVAEFLRHHECDWLVQLHSIAPLISVSEIQAFVSMLQSGEFETLLSGVDEQIQCMIGLEPINFSRIGMDPTQELQPVQRISWSITGWNSATYTQTFDSGGCATFHGSLGFFPLSKPSGMVVKTQEDFDIVHALASQGIGND